VSGHCSGRRESKLKTAGLVHNTFNEVGRIGGFFFPAYCTLQPTRYSPEASENSTWISALIFFLKTSSSSLRQINSAADNNKCAE
jgi:hypothetical protein